MNTTLEKIIKHLLDERAALRKWYAYTLAICVVAPVAIVLALVLLVVAPFIFLLVPSKALLKFRRVVIKAKLRYMRSRNKRHGTKPEVES